MRNWGLPKQTILETESRLRQTLPWDSEKGETNGDSEGRKGGKLNSGATRTVPSSPVVATSGQPAATWPVDVHDDLELSDSESSFSVADDPVNGVEGKNGEKTRAEVGIVEPRRSFLLNEMIHKDMEKNTPEPPLLPSCLPSPPPREESLKLKELPPSEIPDSTLREAIRFISLTSIPFEKALITKALKQHLPEMDERDARIIGVVVMETLALAVQTEVSAKTMALAPLRKRVGKWAGGMTDSVDGGLPRSIGISCQLDRDPRDILQSLPIPIPEGEPVDINQLLTERDMERELAKVTAQQPPLDLADRKSMRNNLLSTVSLPVKQSDNNVMEGGPTLELMAGDDFDQEVEVPNQNSKEINKGSEKQLVETKTRAVIGNDQGRRTTGHEPSSNQQEQNQNQTKMGIGHQPLLPTPRMDIQTNTLNHTTTAAWMACRARLEYDPIRPAIIPPGKRLRLN
jgi:hypothetical protein